jgi:hypothetical protein
MSAGPLPDWRDDQVCPFDLTLIDVMIGMSAQPSPEGEGIFWLLFTPSAFGTSPKYDNL